MRTRGADLAGLAALLADPTRAELCLALLDGRAWTAGELARHAGIAASTATEHLNRLLAGGMLAERRQGRHRYVQLADPGVAELLEALLGRLEPSPSRTSSLRVATATAALARGRTCYDHLAGRLGVTITDAMIARELLDPAAGFALTDAGFAWLTGPLGIAESALRATRRPLVKPCLDWTERRTHLGGVAGAQLHHRLHDLGWIQRSGTGRAVRLTTPGTAALTVLLPLDP
ncbi:ArsR/SmtB family transcription factor [Nocardia sp. NPDC127579]|uniref:ArsR/SmtB family transcription factor n=1 Tax=Nocardia sp. NPDC127579 TaxID=3345402 RepID=UPI003644BB8A